MNQRRFYLILIDIVILLAAYFATALMLQMNIGSLRADGDFTAGKFLLLLVCTFGVRLLLQVYRCLWRYANVNSYLRVVVSDFIGGILFLVIGRIYRPLYIGLACSIIICMIALILTLCSRFFYQYTYAQYGIRQDRSGKANKINIAIIGAGNVGASLAEELIRNPSAHYNPLCFFDTDASKTGASIGGIPIYEENENTPTLIRSLPIQEIVIAIPNATQEQKTKLYNFYRTTGCQIKLYDYPLNELEPTKRGLREFQIEDLLFRDSIAVGSEKTRAFYDGKSVMVTGGGGSIGAELCRQIAALNPKKLIIVDIYENNAYDIQQELIARHGAKLCLEVYIASVRDKARMEQLFRELRPELVIHAAAHKHVPLMQTSGCEAIKNNVFGTYNCAELAEKYGAEKFLLISTDKAVNPTNIMGASKRLCEMVIQCRRDSATEFAAVRFGNVLGSNGSVIPLFKRQIAAGGPITITDKRIIRYFMTIPEAVGLVLESCCMAKSGELFVLDMGKPVKILDLAESMIKLSGLRPYEDIDIVEIGLRPGEKLYEELLMQNEAQDKTENELIFIERDQPLSREAMEEKLALLRRAVDDQSDILEAVRATVPTFFDPDELNRKAMLSREMQTVRVAE